MKTEINSNDDIYQVLYKLDNMKNDNNIDIIIEEINGPLVQKFINMIKLSTYDDSNITLEEKDYQALEILIRLLQTIYNYSDKDTGVSDELFDILYEILENHDVDIVSTKNTILKHKMSHHQYTTLRGTLSKIYALDDSKRANKSRRSLNDWIKSQERRYFDISGKTISLSNEEVYLFPKWNGISIIHEFDDNNNLVKSLTRGNTWLNEAEDVTSVFKPMENKFKEDINGAYGLKTEVIVEDNVFEEYNASHTDKFKSARALCQSLVLSNDLEAFQYLTIKNLRVYFDGHEEVAPSAFNSPYLISTLSNTKAIEDFGLKHKKTEDCDCDGVVIYITDSSIQKVLGRMNDKNQFEVAYKYNEEVKYTKLKDIRFQIGPLGKFTPIAEIEPVKMKGNTISKISLGSYQRFLDLKLSKDDKVKVLYEIIPYLVFDKDDSKCKKSGNSVIKGLKKCPECNFKLVFDENKVPRCENPDCPSKKKGKIINFLRKMNVKGIDYSRVDMLYNNGIIKNITDLLYLNEKADDICELEGFGETTFTNLINEIDENFNNANMSKFLGALGINGASEKTFINILSMYKIDELLEFAKEKDYIPLEIVNGISKKKSVSIIDDLNKNLKVINKFLDNISFNEDVIKPCSFVVVWHLIRSDKVNEIIERKNGKVEKDVTKRTDYLILPSKDINDKKVEKAKKYGVKILTVHEAIDYFNEYYKDN